MTKRIVTNVPASVFARLKKLAQAQRIDVQLIVTRYFIERLLYRLAQSTERDNFILKGAMLFGVWTGKPYRPTKDLDLLGRGPDDIDAMVARMAAICRTVVGADDGVTFDADAIEGEAIRSEEEYHGVRLHVPALLGTVRRRRRSSSTRRWIRNAIASRSSQKRTRRFSVAGSTTTSVFTRSFHNF